VKVPVSGVSYCKAHLYPSGSYLALHAGSTNKFTRDSHTCRYSGRPGGVSNLTQIADVRVHAQLQELPGWRHINCGTAAPTWPSSCVILSLSPGATACHLPSMNFSSCKESETHTTARASASDLLTELCMASTPIVCC
jgi:hypothetical protein